MALAKSIKEAFKFEGAQLRVYGTVEAPWFCGRDICNILGYKNAPEALREHVDIEYIRTLGGIPGVSKSRTLTYNEKKMKVVNEQGLYCLIFNSKMEKAKQFRKWVFEDVLPSIRKKGYFVAPQLDDEKIQALQQELQAEREKNAELEKKQLALTSFVRNTEPIEKKQIFYLATTPAYAKFNRFEFGGVKSLKELTKRINNYNTGRAEGDLMYVCKIVNCSNYKPIEEIIHDILSRYHDKPSSRKELMYLRYNLLEEIVDIICDEHTHWIDIVNRRCGEFFDSTIHDEAIIPAAIDLSQMLEITTTGAGTRTVVKKIDIAGMSDEKIYDIIEAAVNACAQTVCPEYDYATDKHVKDVALAWTDIATEITSTHKVGKMTFIREKFKAWFAADEPKIKIKGLNLATNQSTKSDAEPEESE